MQKSCKFDILLAFPTLCPSATTDVLTTKISLSAVSKSVASATTSAQISVTTVAEQTTLNDKMVQNENEFPTHIHSTLLSSSTSTLLSSSTEIVSTGTKHVVKSKSQPIAIACIALAFMVLSVIAVILYFAWFRKMSLKNEDCSFFSYYSFGG